MASYTEALKAGEAFLRILYVTPHQNVRSLMDSEFGFILEGLWDHVHVDPHEFTSIRDLDLPDRIRNKISKTLHSQTPRDPITVFRVVHFPQDYEDVLTASERQALRRSLKLFGVWNPYREERHTYGRVYP